MLNLDKLSHLKDDDKSFLFNSLQQIHEYSSQYHLDYDQIAASNTRPGETEFLKTYDPTKYGVAPDSFVHTADNVIFTEQYDRIKVLLIQRKNFPFKDYWCLPGGFVDNGEKPLTAAVRELAEETTMRVTPFMLLAVGVYDRPWRDPRMEHVVTHAHTTFIPDLPPVEAADDAASVGLFDVDSLFSNESYINLGFDHKKIISDSISYLLK